MLHVIIDKICLNRLNVVMIRCQPFCDDVYFHHFYLNIMKRNPKPLLGFYQMLYDRDITENKIIYLHPGDISYMFALEICDVHFCE